MKLVGYSSDDVYQAKEDYYKEVAQKRTTLKEKFIELANQDRKIRNSEEPGCDKESHVYLLCGEKRYYRVFIPTNLFFGYGEVEYLGIAQEPDIYQRNPIEYSIKKPPKTKRNNSTVVHSKKATVKEGYCCYCEIPLSEKNFTKEHVIPKRVGGKIIKPCCKDCNAEKGGLMLNSYIVFLNSLDYSVRNQIKIKNANKLAKWIEEIS